MPDSIGNSINDALSIAIGTTTRRFSDSVEFGDQDYLRFTLTGASSFSLALSGLGANADVELLNSIGNPVTANTVLLRSTNEGTLPETINTILDPGTYFIRVFPGPPSDPTNAAGTTPSTNYNLDIRVDDGVSTDIIWRLYDQTTGQNAIWRFEGTNFQSAVGLTSVAGNDWVLSGAGDFNGDGISDVVWRNYGVFAGIRGVNAIWLLDANGGIASVVTTNPVPDFDWQIIGVSDFDNGFGKPELLWWNSRTGLISAWFLDDAFNLTSATAFETNLPFPSTPQALGDFNRDGITDIVWRIPFVDTSGATLYSNAITFGANGFTFGALQGLPPELNPNKVVQGAGDFNGDGFPDLLWRNFATGDNEIWLMEGTSRISIVPILAVADTRWRSFAPYERIEPLAIDDLTTNGSEFVIGALNGNGIYRNEITGNDTDDYYRFTLGSQTRLSLALDGLGTNGLQADLNVQILSSLGAPIPGGSGTNPGSSPEAITNLDLNPGTYLIRVFAGSAGASSPYDLSLSVNNLPILVSSGPVTVNEGQARTLSSTALLVTDENDPPERLIYTLITPPTLQNGSLLSNGQILAANSTFTQADINAGRLVYQQNGSEVPVDTFVFAVADGRGGTIPNTTFTVNATPVNDPPVLRSLNPITVTENLLVTLSNTALLVTDVEQGPGQILYTISSLPTAGILSRLEGSLIGPLTLGNTFTQAEINANRIGYRQDGSERATDSFTFVASDGAGGFLNPQTQTLAINISPVNDPPVLVTNIPLTVSQAGPGFISSTVLRATDAELTTPAQQDQIRYSVTSLPTSGTLFYNSVAQTTPFTFTQGDLNSGNALSYAQGGNPNNSDRFTFRITDGSAIVPTSGEFTYDIFIQRVSGPPVLDTPNPRITLSEGTFATISSTTLQVSDPDSAPFLITYTLGSTPTVGSVVRSGVTLTTGQTFTQQDINNNLIRYQHNGSEQPASDAFTFTFKDEAGAGPNTVQTFGISITPVNDPPVLLTTNIQVTVTEGFDIAVSQTLLNATDNDNLPQDVIYTLTSIPTNGVLQRGNTVLGINGTFTQADVNGAQVKYLQDGSEATADAFTFQLGDRLGAFGGSGTFNIGVIPFNDAPGLASLQPLLLSEGAVAVIDNSLLSITDDDGPGPFTYTIGTLPTNGFLRRGNVTLSTGGTFTQVDINNNQLFYINNGAELVTSDRFTFTASDGATTGAGAPGLIPLTTFSISIAPTNDPPILLTTSPQVTVTEGFGVNITPNILNATDNDNLPQEITYTLLGTPNNGVVLRGTTTINGGETFTQADISGGQIRYLHGGSESTSDSFSFSIADIFGESGGTGTVNITVIPFNDAPGIDLIQPLPLDEGTERAIDANFLRITDNDGPVPTTYTIGTLPINGFLRRGNVTLSAGGTFTQIDVTNGQLFYVNNGNEATSDRFTFTASDNAPPGPGAPGVVPLTTFTITVNPINDPPGLSLNTGLTIAEAGLATISSAALRATDPDNLISELTFNLQSGPASGTLLVNGVSSTSFTQAQLNGNAVSYRHDGSETTLDQFTFEVIDRGNASSGLQTFTIAVTPVNDPPTVTIAGLTVDEGATFTLTPTELDASDPDGPSPSVIFTLNLLPSRGSILRNGTTLSTGQTFTQTDIVNNLISYVDSGRDPVANDRFTFTASDGSQTGIVSNRTFNITVNSINDAPLITAPTSVTATEDSTFTFNGVNTISVADIDGGPTYNVQISTSSGGAVTLGSTSGLTNLNGNNSANVGFTSSLSNLSAALRNLRYRGTQDFNGVEELTITIDDGNLNGATTRIITLNVAAVNDGPTLTASTTALTLLEDAAPATFRFDVNDVDIGGSPMSVVLRATNGSITVSDSGTLSFDPTGANGSSVVIFTGLLADVQTALDSVQYQSNLNYFGSDRIIVSVNDQGATGIPGSTPSLVSRTINVSVTSVNDAPTFTVTGNSVINVNEDTPQQIVPFASNIATGAPNEIQGLSFSIAPSAAADAALLSTLFTATPTISSTSGNLTFTPRANANGTITLSAFLVDNGGVANGGQNTSTPFQFVIEVNPVNDAPSFNRGTVPTVTEDSGPITVSNWATNIAVGPSTATDELATQTPTFIFETSNPSLFAVAPQVVNLSGNTGSLTFTPAPDANGIATVTVRLQDDGGTANGGVNTTAPQTFTINVLSRNDAPTFNQLQTDFAVLEDDPQQSVQIADSIVVGPANELTQTATFTITSNSNPNLFLAANGGIAPTISPQGFLTFKTAANAFGTAVLTARLVDNGGTANGGSNQSPLFSFTIGATAVNDAPSFTRGANQTVSEDAAPQTIPSWATNINQGPGETGQVVNFVVTNDNTDLFTSTGQPTIDPTGRLTYTPAANAFGTAIVTVSLVDNGGTLNGGVDTSTPQTFTITVNAVNDAPTLTVPTSTLTIQEDETLTFTGATAIQLTDIDAGANPIQVQFTVRNGSVLLPAINGLSVTSGANGSSTVTFRGTITDFTAALASVVYTPTPNFNGSDGLTVVVNDLGAFGSGGQKTASAIVPITITSVNDPPELISLGNLVVAEGSNGTISNTLLRTTDVDNSPGQITYSLISAPASGLLRLSLGAGSFTTIPANGTFTQADINSNRLNYLHSGAETTSDSFVFRVTDGSPPLPDATFNITVLPVDDAPTQSLNLGITVDEGNTGTIDGSRLQYIDNDNTSTELIYTLTSLPSSGALRLGGTDLTTGSTFTQEDLNIGSLIYEQNGSETTSDGFNFRIGDRSTSLLGVFNITINPIPDSPDIISQGPLSVNEGASAPLSISILNTTDPDTPANALIYTVTGGPGFGNLLRNGTTTILQGQTFTQAEVNSGAITYRNNGSEITSDAFFFQVSDGAGADSGILNINIAPVNDPPTIVRSTSLSLPAASPTSRVLNNSQLFATDVDNPNPTEVRFVVTSLPNPAIGELLVNNVRLTQNGFFTQDDINRGRVTYRYLGGGSSDGFQYTIQDITGLPGGSRFFPITFTA